jgi:hypothetical protein
MLVRGVFADLTLGLEELGVCKILSKGLIATHYYARARHNRQRNNVRIVRAADSAIDWLHSHRTMTLLRTDRIGLREHADSGGRF